MQHSNTRLPRSDRFRELLALARYYGWLGVAVFAITGNICAQDTAVNFREKVSPLLEASCLDCHDGADESRLDLSELGNDLSDASTFRAWTRVHDRVEKGEMPPAGEDRPDLKLKQTALAAVGDALSKENASFQRANGRVLLRRLTQTEYGHTIDDLLSVYAHDLKEIVPAENSSTSFDTVFNGQGVSPLHVQSYLEAADAALEYAIQLGQKPESKKLHFDYGDHKFVKEHLEKEKEKPIVRQLKDAAVMFNTASYIFKLDHHVNQPGFYKFRGEAYAVQTDRPVVLTLNSGDYKRGYTEVLGAFDLSPDGEPREVEVTVYLRRGQYLFPGAEDLYSKDGQNIWNIGPKDYEGAGIALKWMELEGPLLEQWPPASTENLLKGIKLTELENKKWDPGRQQHIQFEITAGENPRAELERIVGWLAPRAFRRPLEKGEGNPFVDIGVSMLEDERSFDDAIRSTCRAILASPQFLYLSSKPGKLDEFSLATRLSYFLWKSMPDDQLFVLARRGELSKPNVLKKQIERMLDDEKSDRFVKDFVGQWLRLVDIDETSPDKRLYPEFDDLLKQAMLGETESFVSHMIEKDLSSENLIDSDFSFLNRRLAEHYNLGDGYVEGQRIRKVNLPKDSIRGGLLTQASILKVTANGTTTSPVRRGAWVLTHLLGQPPSPPPPSVGSIEPDTRGATTIRELLEKHRSDESCAACHRAIDPPGFAMECFDVIGGQRDRFRSKENGDIVQTQLLGRPIWEYKLAQPVDSSGKIVGGGSFNGIAGYKKLLMKEKEQVARSLISNLVVYSTGAEIQFADRAEVEKILERCRSSNFGLRTMIHEVVQSKLFLHK